MSQHANPPEQPEAATAVDSSRDITPGETHHVRESETTTCSLEREDIEYLRSEWDEVDISNDGQTARVKVKNYVGIIGLPSGDSLSIKPKIDCNLLYLLAYSGHIDEDLVYDAEDAGFEPGDDLEQILAQLFLTELERVLQRGLQQEYQQHERTEKQLRGQLRIQQQLERQGVAPTAFECRYAELTHDTPLNRVILAATSCLCSWLQPSNLRSKLLQHRGRLRRQVSEQPISESVLDDLTLTRLDRHYRRIVALAELILKEQLIGGLDRPDQPLPSLVFNMPNVFESITVRAIRSTIDQETYRITENDLGDLAESRSGDETRSLEPDLVLRDRTTDDCVVAVGDAKWKTDDSPSRGDFYQLAVYQAQEETPGVFVYPDGTETETRAYDYTESAARRGPLLVRSLDVQETDSISERYDDYVGSIKSSAEEIVDDLLAEV
ncbi:McrC family protein [Salinarchaeum sp. IM2453]|uniref:McrC family protein n=1 Tax=Salinarchaeum sp. IM2453 TaxID=2862870 RepID=UPI001C82C66E|nr:McrC family protein [Salinarchaeum sp. IM2453]QZA89513.1 McrC family protein [Salinarchaeum sp. IM2453]